MPVSKECPLCGGAMRLKENKVVVQAPGKSTATSRTDREWICPDCDYFEEAERGET